MAQLTFRVLVWINLVRTLTRKLNTHIHPQLYVWLRPETQLVVTHAYVELEL